MIPKHNSVVATQLFVMIGLVAFLVTTGCRARAESDPFDDPASATPAGAATPPSSTLESPTLEPDLMTRPMFDVDDWRVVLENVDARGLVDYQMLVDDPSALRRFADAVASLDAETFEAFDDEEQVSFWINAYNALTVLAIVERWPLKRKGLGSMMHPRGIRWIAGVWDKLEWTVMGRTMTLDDIEHNTLRKDFQEPRIHAALVCAAMSCPPLRNEPFEGSRLDAQLDEQMRNWVGNASIGMKIDRDQGTVLLSKIFDWYGDDFIPTDLPASGYGDGSDKVRATVAAVARFSATEDQRFLEAGGFRVGYLDYDWSLNEKPSS